MDFAGFEEAREFGGDIVDDADGGFFTKGFEPPDEGDRVDVRDASDGELGHGCFILRWGQARGSALDERGG